MIQGMPQEALDTSLSQYSEPNTVLVNNSDYCLPMQFDEDMAQNMEATLLNMEQIDAPVTHRFAPNIYIREVSMEAGAFVMGHYHKTKHLNIMIKGRIKFLGADGLWVEMKAPQTFVSEKGRKVAFVYEDTIWQNVFSTSETDTEKLEKMYLKKSITWDEHKKSSDMLLGFDNADDTVDYYRAIAEFGLTHEKVQELTNNEDDQIPFPDGSYNVTVADSLIEGKGMFATKTFKEGERIAVARIGVNRTPAGRYINHSRIPNAYPVVQGDNAYIVANRHIAGCKGGSLGEEITIDYRQSLSMGAECQDS